MDRALRQDAARLDDRALLVEVDRVLAALDIPARPDPVTLADLDLDQIGDEAAVETAALREELREAVARQAELFDAGLVWLEAPAALGGRELSTAQAEMVRDHLARHDMPTHPVFRVAHGIVAPTVRAHADGPEDEATLAALLRGDMLACQLFSEPEAGSDLASLQTTARRVDDGWIIRGRKIWSSWAHVADVGELLVRTGAPEDRHRGLTMFMLDMRSPGVTVEPIRQANGAEHFNEVLLEDVLVSDSARLGPVDQGWSVAMTTLGSERAAMGASTVRGAYVSQPFLRLFHLATLAGTIDEGDVQQRLAEVWIREQAALAVVDRLREDDPPLSGSVAKLAMVEDLKVIADVVVEAGGLLSLADQGLPGTHAWADFMLTSPGQRIAGGTDDIQRNIVAQRVLGMPRS